jgi:hypothetical protein
MTLDECQQILSDIRLRQGTQHPLVRVDLRGTTYMGRLLRSDSDPEYRQVLTHRYGLLVLADPGLGRHADSVLQIAELPCGAIKEVCHA